MRIELHGDVERWRELHRGRITASRAALISHGGPGAWSTYLKQLRAECKGQAWGGGSMPATDWGIKYEGEKPKCQPCKQTSPSSNNISEAKEPEVSSSRVGATDFEW